jgi:thiol peroxidase
VTIERKGVLKLGGVDATIIGKDIEIGQQAPEFTAHKQDYSLESMMASSSGKVRIIASVPSLQTSVCDRETRRFNEEASKLSDDIVIITISTDLPISQANWCGAAGIENVTVVSDHLETEFGIKYGTLIKERRQLRRAVFIVDREGIIRYVDYMPSLGDEPDYEEVIAAASQLVA